MIVQYACLTVFPAGVLAECISVCLERVGRLLGKNVTSPSEKELKNL